MTDRATLVCLSVKAETDECERVVYMQSARGESFIGGMRIPYAGLKMLREAFNESSVSLSGDFLWRAVDALAHAWGGVLVKATKHMPSGEWKKEWYICRRCTYRAGKQVNDSSESFTGKINTTDDIGL